MTVAGFEKVTAMSTVKSLTVPAGARYARIQAQAQAVRFTLDGSTPNATTGVRIAVGETIELSNDTGMAAAKFIEEAASANLAVHYFV